jgi:hypothetical protein
VHACCLACIITLADSTELEARIAAVAKEREAEQTACVCLCPWMFCACVRGCVRVSMSVDVRVRMSVDFLCRLLLLTAAWSCVDCILFFSMNVHMAACRAAAKLRRVKMVAKSRIHALETKLGCVQELPASPMISCLLPAFGSGLIVWPLR